MMRERSIKHERRIANSPMSLEGGKPEWKDALLSTGVTLAFLFASTLGAWIAYLFGPKEGGSLAPWDYSFVGGPRLVGVFFGILSAVFCLQQAWIYSKLTRQGWEHYYKRLDAWHRATLRAFNDAQGQESTVTYREYELIPKYPASIITAAMWVQQQMRDNRREDQYPYSSKALNKALYLSKGNGGMLLIGELSGTNPEQMSTAFSSLGLIVGRKEGYAGKWVPRDEGEAIEMIVQNWNKLGKKPLYEEDEEIDEDY